VLLRFSAYRMMCVRGVGTAFETFVLFCRIALYDNSFAAFLQFHFIPVGLQANSFEWFVAVVAFVFRMEVCL